MPSKKELDKYQEEYGMVSKNDLDRIYEFLDNFNDKNLKSLRTDIEKNLETKIGRVWEAFLCFRCNE